MNLFGGPGSGKSTFMANLFYHLKCRGVEVEMAPEFAKDLVWEERVQYFDEQIYIFAKQLHRINRVNGKVDVCISDSPLQNFYIYLKEEYPELKSIIDKEFFQVILYFKWNLILSKQMPRAYLHLPICQIMDLNP